MGSQAEEVDWDRLDKNKFFVHGAAMFSGVTVALYPLSVIKTKQMTLPGISGGFKGVKQTASVIMRSEGVPGFYRGFGTVIFGMIPSRALYLSSLEWSKSEVTKAMGELQLTGPATAGLANFVGGAMASLSAQAVTVPIDVISQKQVVHGDETVVARHQHSRAAATAVGSGGGGSAAAAAATPAAQGNYHGPTSTTSASGPPGVQTPHATAGATSSSSSLPSTTAGTSHPEASSRSIAEASTSGRPQQPHPHQAAASRPVRIGALQMVQLIIKEEGLSGLYRGFGASVATFVPSSAVWWGAYGAYQKLIWSFRHRVEHGAGEGQAPHLTSTTDVVVVQTTSSVLAGCTSSLVTTPLDLVKTRIQVSYKHDGATPTFGEVARQILREDGASGFLRGAVPRMLNASLWGTCMVTVYEYLKRICAKDSL